MEVVGANGREAGPTAEKTLARALAGARDPAAIGQLERLMQNISKEPLYRDNDVRLLIDGPDTYAAMLGAIAAAQDHINLETYIFNDDEAGQRFAEALIAKSREGVKVRVIFDSLGSRASDSAFFERMKEAGIGLVEFNPVNPLDGGNPLAINIRDHRKILVVDGRVAFTGGINIDRSYSSSSGIRRRTRREKAGAGWRDTHIQVRGPAVAGFQKLFLKNWAEGKGEGVVDEQRYFPEPRSEGTQLVRVLSAVGGDDKISPIRIAYGAAMEAASDRIWITQSYFGPDPEFLETMQAAARRGVDVRIIVTGVSDAPLLLHVSRSGYGELLEAGVRIYESSDTMLHAKTAVIDGVWSTVGSSNLDYRSFIHNHEVNAVVVGRDFGKAMDALFRSDVERSTAITREAWENRPLLDRIKEKLGWLLQYWL